MSSINSGLGGTGSAQTVNQTTTAAPASGVNATTPPDPGTAPTAPIPSAAGTIGPQKLAINGVADAFAKSLYIPSFTPGPGQAPAAANWGKAQGRGWIEARCAPAQGGWVFEVDTHYQNAGEIINLFLSARVTDPPKEHWVILGVPHEGAMTPDSLDADGYQVTTTKVFVSLKDINSFLLQKAGVKADGKTPKLVFRPGDPLSFDAVWGKGTHQCGGRRDQTKGGVVTMPVLGRQTAVSVQIDPVISPVKTVTSAFAPKPVDLVIKLPDAMVEQYPNVLAPGATLVSRREEEMKIEPKTFDELKDFTLRLIDLARATPQEQQKTLKEIFGEDGWHLHLTDRYYQKDDQGKVKAYTPGELVWKVKDETGERDFDFAGLPKVAGMYDQYQDRVETNSWERRYNFQVGRANGAVRFRDGEIKGGESVGTMGKFNLKPGGGAVDPTSFIATRIEYSLDTLPGIAKDPVKMAEFAKFLNSAPAPLNPLLEFKKKDWEVNGNVILSNVLDNDALRYKFTLAHTSGLEVELSNDFIELASKNPAIAPPSTKTMNIDQKYAYWQGQFAAQNLAFDATADAVNKGTFIEYTQNGKYRVAVDVEVSVDANGQKVVQETLRTRGRQVEVEMDHVQAFATGNVQTAGATQAGTNAVSAASEDSLFKALSDNATFSAPPTVHNLEDLAQPELYEDPSYLQMKAAASSLRVWGFPKGVNATRQKASFGLEAMEVIRPMDPPKLQVSLPSDGTNSASVTTNAQTIHAFGNLKSGNPTTLTIKFDDFPLLVYLKGTETAAELADAIAKKLDECILWKPVVTPTPNTPDTFEIKVVAR
jgi:hypothetical protein